MGPCALAAWWWGPSTDLGTWARLRPTGRWLVRELQLGPLGSPVPDEVLRRVARVVAGQRAEDR